MVGYWNDLQKIVEVIDVDGWMYIGDLVEMDLFGYVWIVGWIKDFVVWGGENILLWEIEEFFYMYFDIVDGYVIGVFDVKYGEEFMVVVKLRNDVLELIIEWLCEYCMGCIV